MPAGRPKKPIPIRAVEGDKQKLGSRKFAQMVQTAHAAKRGRPELPEGLDPIAAEHFEFLCDRLFTEQLIAEIDLGSIVSAATAYSAIMKAHKGSDFINLDKAIGRYMQIADRLGLHESARAKFTKKPDAIDEVEAAMFG